MSCIFCNIRDGNAQSYIVYEDEQTLAFLDNKPVEAGHVLLIPRVHKQYIGELSEYEAISLMKALVKLVPLIQRSMGTTDSSIAINNGPKAGQIIPHVHIHIIPRPNNAGASLFHGVTRRRRRKEDYFEEIAEKIRKEIEDTKQYELVA